ncbi:DNA repair protein crb2 [Echria macrotheca]|uniref:DNA repair protein crb2 n=1 Tax=Echria macrotheca TaxID=438768 RepID=A0AAJ0BM47_9PEZI|nr:DNA repair protein crb2 [Echria macrotheca]
MSAGSALEAADMLDTQDDSQLSQALYEDFMKNGIGILSSSPPPVAQGLAANEHPISPASLQSKASRKSAKDSERPLNLSPVTRRTRDVSGERYHTPRAAFEDRDALDVPTDGRLDGPAGQEGPARKMDSAESQTQSNGGRSYDQYTRSSPSRKLVDDIDPVPAIAEEHLSQASAADDTTSEVRLDLDVINSAEKSFSTEHRSNMVSQTSRYPQVPETPAPPQNPFRQSRSQLLAPSQLFGGTQFSSAIKIASPTSSRPSPDDFRPHNSISPNPPAVISSPLKARGLRSSPPVTLTSSPQVVAGTTSTILEGPSSPSGTTSSKPVIPDSQNYHIPKSSIPEPRARSPSSSADEDDSFLRRRKAKLRKEAALKQLDAVTLPVPTKPDDVEVPSTTKRRRSTDAAQYVAQCHGTEPEDIEETVADSQPHAEADEVAEDDSTQSEADEVEEPLSMPDTAPALPVAPLPSHHADDKTSGEAIPETSPIGRPSALPGVTAVVSPGLALAATEYQSSPPALSTRSRRARGKGSTSSLSNLASTPVASPVHPPKADPAPAVDSSSPAVIPPAKGKRRETMQKPSRLSAISTENLRGSAQRGRRMSTSTDELSRSASATPTFEHSLRMSRISTSKSRTFKGPWRGPKIFEGMAFAISFQSRKPGETNDQYKTRMDFALNIETRIRQAGGKVLETGFDELFEAPPRTGTPSGTPELDGELTLNESGRATGFTALIADGHSRKVKYMQALALGLPCIASRWITSCLDRGEILDWAPYLLCAGQSSFLGDAIRSRNLVPYDAATARLVSVVAQRSKLLEGSRILLVVKKALEGKKMAYVFLARVLGASVARVYSVDEARVEAKAAEEAGYPFDWVYVDGKENAGDLVEGVSNRKRKRASVGADESAAKRIRTLSDELVIQSLILGRMIIED